jgi:hypothetical protein
LPRVEPLVVAQLEAWLAGLRLPWQPADAAAAAKHIADRGKTTRMTHIVPAIFARYGLSWNGQGDRCLRY